jgi:hypothetical protein
MFGIGRLCWGSGQCRSDPSIEHLFKPCFRANKNQESMSLYYIVNPSPYAISQTKHADEQAPHSTLP